MDVWFLLNMILRRLPMLLIVPGGLVFALVRVRRHPKVSLVTIIGLLLLLLQLTLFTVAVYALPTYVNRLAFERGLSTSDQQWIYSGVYAANDLVFALVIILLVAAALMQRTKPPIATAR
jgi:hypothetical protein